MEDQQAAPSSTAESQAAAPPSSSASGLSFEDLRLRVGARLQLLLARYGRTDSFGSVLIGYVEGEYLIVRTPTEGGFAMSLANGEWLKVRLFTGTRVAEFDTALQRQFGAPVSYWHLQYPQTVRASILRVVPRVRVELPVQVVSGDAPVAARIVDLGEHGAQIVAAQPLGERDGHVQLRFGVPTGSDGADVAMSLKATIRAVKPLPAGAPEQTEYAHGVRFDNPNDQDRLMLQNFVLQRLAAMPSDGG
jgi:hypothetical protein